MTNPAISHLNTKCLVSGIPAPRVSAQNSFRAQLGYPVPVKFISAAISLRVIHREGCFLAGCSCNYGASLKAENIF